MSGLVSSLLPADVLCEETDDVPGAAGRGSLHPAEAAVVRDAVEKRRLEFTAARVCARRAMERLGVPPAPVVPGSRGAPQWPAGIVGSMSHCPGYVAAALARAGRVAAVGIDVETDGPLPPGLAARIARPEELGRLAALAGSDPDIAWDRLLFSIKESVYKAWYPLTQRWLGFPGATVSIDPGGGFRADLCVAGPVVGGTVVQCFPGRWARGHGVIATAVVVSSPSFP